MRPETDFPKDFLTLASLAPEQLRVLLRLTDALRDVPVDLCAGDTLALLFEKPSTRTRVSFTVAFQQLGGQTIFLSPDDIQLARGESIPDTARTLSRYVRMIACRTFGHDRVEALAEHTSVPVINALTDWAHPCQALADVYTLFSVTRSERPRLVYVGDGNNVCHSLMQASAQFEFPLTVSTPAAYGPDPNLLENLRDGGAPIEVEPDPHRAVRDADVLYTDVWTSMGEEDEARERREAFGPYQVNEELVASAPDGVRVMHCLPAHRGEEITDAVMDGPHSIVFDQAENRLHVQKALMAALVAPSDKLQSLLS